MALEVRTQLENLEEEAKALRWPYETTVSATSLRGGAQLQVSVQLPGKRGQPAVWQ